MLQLPLVYEWCLSLWMSVWCDEGQTGHESDHAFVLLQLCLGGLGLQAWRLQQETLWFGWAGESHPQCIHLFAALFVSPHPLHCFFSSWSPFCFFCFPLSLSLSLNLCLSLSLSHTPCIPLFLLVWMDNRGGLMSHDVLGVVQRCALPAWITIGAPLTVMQDAVSKVHLFCFETAGAKLQHSVCFCGWLLSCWVIVTLGECVCVCECTIPPLWAESVHPDSPEGQEVLRYRTAIALPTRDTLWVCP